MFVNSGGEQDEIFFQVYESTWNVKTLDHEHGRIGLFVGESCSVCHAKKKILHSFWKFWNTKGSLTSRVHACQVAGASWTMFCSNSGPFQHHWPQQVSKHQAAVHEWGFKAIGSEDSTRSQKGTQTERLIHYCHNTNRKKRHEIY